MSNYKDWIPQVGQKVMCVNSGVIDGQYIFGRNQWIKDGRVYTIESVTVCSHGVHKGKHRCTLVECKPIPDDTNYFFAGFMCFRFAPIDPLYNDITAELARQATDTPETADQPVRVVVSN